MDAKGPKVASKGKIWLYQGKAAWHFVTLPKRISSRIKTLFGGAKRGWGSLPVLATLGRTQWRNSIFADKKQGAYVLPLKKELRLKEGIAAGHRRTFTIELML